LYDLEKAVKRIEKRKADKAKKEQKKQEAAAKGKDEDEGDDENEGRNTIAGGMFVSLKPGSGMVFEQERINNEVWMPSYQEVNFAARVFLIKGFTGNSVTRFSDYKIFNVNAEKEKLKDPVKPE